MQVVCGSQYNSNEYNVDPQFRWVLTSAGLLVPLISALASSSVAPGDPGVTSGSLSPAVFTVSATTAATSLFSAAELILCVVCGCD